MLNTHKDCFIATGLFLGSLLLFTWGLSSQEIIGFDSRFYLFAQEMLRNGPDWFPTTYQHPYPDYTGASTFLIYLVARLAGGLNKLTAVIPTATLAAFTVALTYLIAAKRNRTWGLCAVFFLMLTLTFVKSARALALDMYPTAISAACFYILYSAKHPNRTWWIYPLLLLGFVFRGPIGLVIPTGVVCAYYFLDGQYKRLLQVGCCALILLLVANTVLLLLAHHVGGSSFAQDVLRMQMLGRMENHFLPRYFYFTNSMHNYALTFPICWLVLAGLAYYAISKRESSVDLQLLVKLTGWLMVILLGMAVPDDKKVRYILPMAPAIALIAAYIFVAPAHQKYFTSLRWLLTRALLILPILFLLLLVLIYFYAEQHALNIPIHYGWVMLLLLMLQTFALLCFYYRDYEPVYILGAAALCFALVNILVVEPIELYIDSAQVFVLRVESARQKAHARLVFYKESPDGLTIKYLINMPQSEQPEFVTDPQTLNTYPAPAYFVASENYFTELPKTIAAHFSIIERNKLGHVPVVVFKN